MFFKQLLQSSTVRLALIALVLCSVSLVGSRSTGEAKAAALNAITAQQTNISSSEIAPEETSGKISAECDIARINVSMIYNLIDLRIQNCSPSTGDIEYLYVSADSKHANQVLSIALMAQATGRKIDTFYDSSDTSGLPSGYVANHRKMLTIELDQ